MAQTIKKMSLTGLIIWMVSTVAKVWVPFSTFMFGADMTQHWRIAGLEPTQVVGLLAVGWMVLVTCVASRGINKNARITAVGGIAVMSLNFVLLVVSVAIMLLTGGHFAQEIHFSSSPHPGYQSGLAMLSFVVFAIFAYGGIEAGDWNSALWMTGGPVFFSLLAMAIYQNYSRRMADEPRWAVE